VVHAGKTAVDALGGPVDRRCLFYAASTAKPMTSTVVHVLAEGGVLNYEMPLVEVWPEFGAHGKKAVTVRHVLCHTAGVPGLPPGTTAEQLCDWEQMCAVIAAASCSGSRAPGSATTSTPSGSWSARRCGGSLGARSRRCCAIT
jgi:CubicO group peptidase (beta-lactamase class C family)